VIKQPGKMQMPQSQRVFPAIKNPLLAVVAVAVLAAGLYFYSTPFPVGGSWIVNMGAKALLVLLVAVFYLVLKISLLSRIVVRENGLSISRTLSNSSIDIPFGNIQLIAVEERPAYEGRSVMYVLLVQYFESENQTRKTRLWYLSYDQLAQLADCLMNFVPSTYEVISSGAVREFRNLRHAAVPGTATRTVFAFQYLFDILYAILAVSLLYEKFHY
jgi:hypothetical protein